MRVLVVEDEEKIALYTKKHLEAEGFSVSLAFDGCQGLDLALSESFDAITLDVMLPGMNGYAVCKAIRDAGLTTPVLMLTAKDGEYDEADALDIGADDFLRKPFSLVVLMARLRALMRRAARRSSNEIVVQDLRLNPVARTAHRAGVQLELTPREYAILEYLMANAGQVLSKPQILDHVWGPESGREENVVEVYVGYLRKKVDAPFDVPLIKTVRGVGYQMRSDG